MRLLSKNYMTEARLRIDLDRLEPGRSVMLAAYMRNDCPAGIRLQGMFADQIIRQGYSYYALSLGEATHSTPGRV